MGKSLVIVESPAKAKTINKYLGNQYVVKSSIGHIRDLPTSGSASASKEPAAKRGKAAAGEGPVLTPKEKARKQLVSRMGVDPEHGWKAKYEILPGKEKVIEELRRLAKDADTIYLATDLDREGKPLPGTCAKPSVVTTAATSAWCSTKSPRKRFRKRSPSRASWTSIV
jgi:DNA topoisomerase-1